MSQVLVKFQAKIMCFIAYSFLFLSTIGLAVVASNPSPNYGALSLVVAAGSGCGFLAYMGSSFLSLVLFLVYLGGMLVVFAYSIAFTASLSLDCSNNYSSLSLYVVFVLGALICSYMLGEELEDELWVSGTGLKVGNLVEESTVSVALLYKEGGGFLVISSLALLVVLVAVLIVVRGTARGALRAV